MEDWIFENFGKLILAFMICLCFFIPWALEKECHAKIEGSGLSSEYSFFGGCKVEYSDGKLIPLERYLVIQE